MKKYTLYLCIFTLYLSRSLVTTAQTASEQATINLIINQDTYKSSITGFKSDANYLFDGFASVAVKSLAYQLNAGWIIGGKPLGSLPRFSLMLVGSLSNTPAEDKTFYVDNNKLDFIQLKSDVDGVGESRNVSTIFGDKGLGIPQFEAKPSNLSVHPDQVGVIPPGAGINYLPSAYLRGQVGLFKGTDLIVKLLPAVTIGSPDLTIKSGWMYGVGVQHSISQWLYGKKAVSAFLPNISVVAGYTSYDLTSVTQQINFGAEFNDENTYVATASPTTFSEFRAGLLPQETYMKFSAMQVNLAASWTFAIITPYVAVGYSSINTDVEVKGDYPIVVLDPSNSFLANKYLITKTTNPIKSSSSYSNIMLTAGGKINLGIFSLNLNYQLIDYAIYTIGVAFGI